MLLARNIVATKQMGKSWELLGPGELFQQAAEIHHLYGACLSG